MSSESGKIAMGWWSQNIEPRDVPAARALAARLRRAAPLAALCEPSVIALGHRLGLRQQGDVLFRLVTLLAEIRAHDAQPLARRLGRTDPVLSPLRFQRLMRADETELAPMLRRAILMADRRCNVAALAGDLLHWNEATRIRWCFDYFGAPPPGEPAGSDIEETTL